MRLTPYQVYGTCASDRILEVEYPLAFGNAFSKTLERKFRYICLSGATTERDQTKTLWFKGEMRKMKDRKVHLVLYGTLIMLL
jgi:hypothetical protein